MDNLGAHRPKRGVRELIEDKGCELIYLPPYSPDFNPIEEAFSKVKHILRKIGAHGKDTLIEAMGRALWEPCVQKTCGGSSLTVATAYGRSNYERCCRNHFSDYSQQLIPETKRNLQLVVRD
jgi:transposase